MCVCVSGEGLKSYANISFLVKRNLRKAAVCLDSKAEFLQVIEKLDLNEPNGIL